MATFEYVDLWYNSHQVQIEKMVNDPEKILSSDNGHKRGGYLVSVLIVDENKLIPMYAGEAGADGEHDRTIADRLKEHLRIWLGDRTEYWTGIKRSDLETGKMKLNLHIVQEAELLDKRKEIEAQTILSEHPYLQYGPYKKYPSKYDGLDLCIVPWHGTRRKAFTDRLREEGISDDTELVERILDKEFKPDWKKCVAAGKENADMGEALRQSILPGSEEYLKVKKKVDKGLGFKESSRGCTYPYVIRVLSHALSDQ